MTEIEALKLKQQNILLQAQSLERDIIVLNYKSLMEQANALQQEIVKAEEEVRKNEEAQNVSDGITVADLEHTAD